MTEAELRTADAGGQDAWPTSPRSRTFDQDALVDALVAAEKERLAAAVTDGRLTQAEADERAADLEARITEWLDKLCGPGGRGGRPAPGDDAAPVPDAPSTSDSATADTAADAA